MRYLLVIIIGIVAAGLCNAQVLNDEQIKGLALPEVDGDPYVSYAIGLQVTGTHESGAVENLVIPALYLDATTMTTATLAIDEDVRVLVASGIDEALAREAKRKAHNQAKDGELVQIVQRYTRILLRKFEQVHRQKIKPVE